MPKNGYSKFVPLVAGLDQNKIESEWTAI